MNMITLTPGDLVRLGEANCEIISADNSGLLHLKHMRDGHVLTAHVHEVRPASDGKKEGAPSPAWEALNDRQKKRATRRWEAIKGVIQGEKTATTAAKAANVSERTIYNWLNAYRDNGMVSALATLCKTSRKRKSRLNQRQLRIISEVGDNYLDTRQKPRMSKAVREVIFRCGEASVEVPHENTIRNHLKRRNQEVSLRKREGAKAARQVHEPLQGSFPHATRPLSVVQMDHTPLDIILVDEKNRDPYKRATLTLAVDVHTRIVTGFSLSYEKPSMLTAGLCLHRAITPKAPFLESLGVKGQWPVWGLMDTLHLDNAAEFRSKDMENFCLQYGVSLEYRAVGRPEMGGIVERLLQTINEEVHTQPGTTFSNPQQRGEYESKKRATYTLAEMEDFLAEFIVNDYHLSHHDTLGMSPMEAWNLALRGSDKKAGISLPPRVVDEDALRIALLPGDTRKVQRSGICWDYMKYWAPVLSNYLSSKTAGKKTSFQVRRDPRNVENIWFMDPASKQWIKIPYKDTGGSPMSLKELQRTTRELKRLGRGKKILSPDIHASIRRRRQLQQDAVKKTKKVRTENKKRGNRKKRTAIKPDPSSPENVAPLVRRPKTDRNQPAPVSVNDPPDDLDGPIDIPKWSLI